MKTLKLNFIQIWVVSGWQTEMRTGLAHKFEKLKTTFTDEDKYLFYPEDTMIPEIITKYDVCTTLENALSKLASEKKKYIEFCEKQVKEYTAKLLKLK